MCYETVLYAVMTQAHTLLDIILYFMMPWYLMEAITWCMLVGRSVQSISPSQFVTVLRQLFPQFAQTSPRGGGYMQQDAEEFYNTMVQSLSQGLQAVGGHAGKTCLTFELEETLSCAESDAESMSVRRESVNKLVCNIQGGLGSQVAVDHLQDGLKLALEGTVEKHSEVLGRNALWNKKGRIDTLPRYLCVQFMRFFWKATPDSMDHAGVKCKILRPVSYPEVGCELRSATMCGYNYVRVSAGWRRSSMCLTFARTVSRLA